MIGKISVNGMMEPWKENFRKNPQLPFITESSSISLELLKSFLQQAEENCPGYNGVRIYFIRYDEQRDNLKNNLKQIRQVPGTSVSQVSLAFVPVKNFDPVTLAGQDFTDGNQIFTLAFCHPSADHGSGPIGTGHCPPACDPPKNEDVSGTL